MMAREPLLTVVRPQASGRDAWHAIMQHDSQAAQLVPWNQALDLQAAAAQSEARRRDNRRYARATVIAALLGAAGVIVVVHSRRNMTV